MSIEARTAKWLWLLPLSSLLLLLFTLGDPTLADSLAFRLKAESLGLVSMFRPDQVHTANPYYRPLFLALHHLFDQLAGDLGLRVLAVLCHASAVAGLIVLARSFGVSARAILAAVGLFLWLPSSTVTVLWPVVGYWSLSAAFAFLAMAQGIHFQRTAKRSALLGALGLAALSSLCAETVYFLPVFAGVLFLVPAAGSDQNARKRAILLGGLLSALCLAHLELCESGASGLAGGSKQDLLRRVAQRMPAYWILPFGADRFVGLPLLPWGLFGTLLVLAPRSRASITLLLLAILGALPFAVIGVSERYAYFSSALFCTTLATTAFPSGTEGPIRGARLLFGLVLLVAIPQSLVRALDFHRAAVHTGAFARSLSTHRDLLVEHLDEVALVNLSAMDRWYVADLFEPQGSDEFLALWQRISSRRYPAVHGDTTWFPAGPLPPGTRHVLEVSKDEVLVRSLAAPLGPRRPAAAPWFLAEDFVVVPREPTLLAPGRTELLHRDRVLEASRTLPDPDRKVVLERVPEGLQTPLATSGATFTFHPASAPEGGIEQGVRIPGSLEVELDLLRPGLVVVAIDPLGAEDDVPRILGDVGRFCSLLEAELDGEVVPIEPVFYHCPGVVVPPGSHHLVLRQRTR